MNTIYNNKTLYILGIPTFLNPVIAFLGRETRVVSLGGKPARVLPVVSTRSFSATAVLGVPNLRHPLVWRVDWMVVQSGQYAVIDPESPNQILYLTKKEYVKLIGIVESNDSKLTVLASPYDARPADSEIAAPKPENSPPQKTVGHAIFWRGMLSRISRSYRAFLNRGSGMFDSNKVPKYLDGLVKRWSLALGHWAGLKQTTQTWFKDILSTLPHMQLILKRQGTSGLVLRLKTSSLLINQYLAGTPQTSHTYPYHVALTHGLPSWLPLGARMAIRARHLPSIRLWLSVLYIYKIIQMPHEISGALKSIQTVPKVVTDSMSALMAEYRLFLREHYVPTVLGGKRHLPKHKIGSFFTPVSAGPNGSPAINKVAEDAAALTTQMEEVAGNPTDPDKNSIVHNIINVAMSHDVPLEVYDITDLGRKTREERELNNDPGFKVKPPKRLEHSKVHILGEPAGKLRPIAIFDIFSQRVLKPLHDDIYAILKKIKQDGTFSQGDLMKWLKECARTDWSKGFWSSLDISAATDTIPLQLYRILLEELYGLAKRPKEYADEILQLMTDRDFTVQVDQGVCAPKAEKNMLPRTVRYGTGQPMGCLGSFALLALWNHTWVQFAAWLVTGKMIENYGVTGDDVVICEPDRQTPIGHKYVSISNEMGISISLPKSFVSSTLFNFLSRTVIGGMEISPASLKEDTKIRDSSTRLERALKLLERDWWNVDGNGWLSKASKMFLYPSEYLVSSLSTRKGKLDGYGLRSLFAFLSPSPSIAGRVGLSGVPIFGWLTAFRGSTLLFGHSNLACANTHPSLSKHAGNLQKLLADTRDLIIREITELYLWNDSACMAYTSFLEGQNSALREPGVGCLFLPTEWDYHSYHLDDSRWCDMGSFPELAAETLVTRLGESWYAPENAAKTVENALNWLIETPKSRDFSDMELFAHLASIQWAERRTGEKEFNARERQLLSLLYLISSAYPSVVDITVNTKMADYLERKFLSSYIGYTVGEDLL